MYSNCHGLNGCGKNYNKHNHKKKSTINSLNRCSTEGLKTLILVGTRFSIDFALYKFHIKNMINKIFPLNIVETQNVFNFSWFE